MVTNMLPDRAETEVWFRNPGAYAIELAELGCYNIVFDYGYIYKRQIEPVPWCNMRFGTTSNWRCIVVHHDRSVLYTRDGGSEPQAVWPTWQAGQQSIAALTDMMIRPWGERKNLLNNPYSKTDARPVAGQRHLVVISELPDQNVATGSQFVMELGEFQKEHPEVTFFIHGTYSFRGVFSNRFKAADFDPRFYASRGKIVIPPGRVCYPYDLRNAKYWIEIMGFDQNDLKDPKMRCKYNIKSLLFAGTYWHHLRRFAVARSRQDDYWETPLMEAHIKENSLVFTKRLVARPGDRVVCDDCSLWMSCKYFREGAVCAVEKTDMQKVSDLFGTRDSAQIQTALTRLVQANTERIERGMKAEATPIQRKDGEEEDRPIDPALSKLITDTFKMGDRLLQIVDPSMRAGKPTVNVAVGGGANRVEITTGQGDDQQLISTVVGMLEARGIRREDITEDMVNMALREIGNGEQKALEGQVVP